MHISRNISFCQMFLPDQSFLDVPPFDDNDIKEVITEWLKVSCKTYHFRKNEISPYCWILRPNWQYVYQWRHISPIRNDKMFLLYCLWKTRDQGSVSMITSSFYVSLCWQYIFAFKQVTEVDFGHLHNLDADIGNHNHWNVTDSGIGDLSSVCLYIVWQSVGLHFW